MNNNDEVDEPNEVRSDLDEYAPLPTLEQETAVWRARAHLLWLRASNDGDVRGMTAALGVAAKSLDAWRNEMIEAEKKVAKKEAKASGGDDQPLTVAYVDRIVREYRARNQAVCPTCLGFGDRERLRQFKDWLQRQEPEVVRGFTKWSESTPKHINGILGSETSGVKINGNSNSST